MANTPYPLPRQTRESTIQVGNGTAGPYGPSLYRVFDIEDVRVYLQAEDEENFTDVTSSCVVTKTAGDGYDTFSVMFAGPVPATSRWYHAAKRVANRSVAVTRAGTLVSDELEKELSKQATVLSETRRDLGRALKVDPDQEEVWVQPLADGHISVWRNNQLVDGGSVDAIHDSADSASASAVAAAISAGNAADSADAAAGSAGAAAGAAISAANSADDAAGDRALAVAAANSAANSAGAAADDRAAVALDRAAVADDKDAAAASALAAAGSANSAANSAGDAADDRAAVALDRAAVADDKDAAAVSAGAASSSAGAAAGSASKADEWANTPENQPVEPGKYSAFHWSKKAEEAAGGGMQPAIYDPNGVQDDAFSMDNMAEGTNTKIMTAAERTAIGANSSARHSHSNKAVLDATQQAFTTTLKSKLDGVAAGATANQSNAYLLDRSNHTGIMPLSGLDQGASGGFVVGRLASTGNVGRVNAYYAATADSMPIRETGGALQVGAPTIPAHAATKKYVDDSIAAVLGTKFTDVSGSRVRNTVYQNTTGRWLIVYAGSANNGNSFEISADGTTWYEVTRGSQSYSQAVFVPPGWRYRANPSSGTLTWLETVD